jgi:GT2 family glycosyltransferase
VIHFQILLYKSSRFIEGLINGLNSVDGKEEFVIHFLENSNENSIAYLERGETKPLFKFTYDKAPENLGFGKGHNFLFNKYNKDYEQFFFVLNHDMVPFFNFYKEFEKFEQDLDDKWGAIELTQFPKEHPKEFSFKNYTTEWVSGAATAYKTKLFKSLEGFDESLFMYCEDVDLSWRIKHAGSKLFHCPSSQVGHFTRELDEEKDPSFEEIYSRAGNLYLRYKYFGTKSVNKYQHMIKSNPYFKKIMVEYKNILSRAKEIDLEKYRGFSEPKIYPDTNYAKHRW